MGNGKFCPSCGAAAAAAPPPQAPDASQQPAWANDPRTVNVNSQFEQPQFGDQPQPPAWTPPAWQPVQTPSRPFYKRWWFWLLLVLGGLLVIGLVVGGGEGLSEEELIGRWNWDEASQWHYIFNDDGTGSRSTNTFGRERFYWSVSGRTLRIESQTNSNLQFGRRIERWTMRYNDGRLTLSLGGTTYHYLRVGGGAAVVPDVTVPAAGTEPAQAAAVTAEQLVGTWNWNTDQTWQYFFAPNGEGTRGGGLFAVEEFTWEVEDGVLFIDSIDGAALQFGVANEEWTVSIAGNTLTLRSRQAQALVYTYIRAD